MYSMYVHVCVQLEPDVYIHFRKKKLYLLKKKKRENCMAIFYYYFNQSKKFTYTLLFFGRIAPKLFHLGQMFIIAAYYDI